MTSSTKSRRSKINVGADPFDKVMAKIEIDESTGCWHYTGWKNAAGYGMYSHREDGRVKHKLVHRLVWEHFNGEIQDGLWVLHSCDVRDCCNPDHLRLGTHSDNVADIINRNRIPRGEDCHIAVLSESEVMEIRRMWDQGQSISGIARKFQVSRWAIYQIGRRNTWKHLPESG